VPIKNNIIMSIKKLLIPTTVATAVAAVIGSFTLTTNGHSLESLSASAGNKCVEKENSDCKSESTGQIYIGYTKKAIGGGEELEP